MASRRRQLPKACAARDTPLSTRREPLALAGPGTGRSNGYSLQWVNEVPRGLLSLALVSLWFGLLSTLSSCESQPKRPQAQQLGRTWRSEHFAYHSRPDDESVCEGILQTLEAHHRAVHDVLRLEANNRVIDYYKYRDSRDLERHGHCSATSSSCFFSNLGIETSHAFERHELVHAYLSPLGDSHKLLEEGVAEALSCGAEHRAAVDVNWHLAFSPRHWRGADISELRRLYAAGSWFTAHLLRELGAARFLQFYSRLSPDAGAKRAAAEFQAVYGLDLATVWNHALAQEQPELACVYAYECSAPGTGAGPACEFANSFRALDFAPDQWVREQGATRSVRLVGCGQSPPLPHLVGTDPWRGQVHGQLFHYLPDAGRYFYEPASNRARLELHPLEKHLGAVEDCARLEAWTSNGERSLLFAVGQQALRELQPLLRSEHSSDNVAGGAARPRESAQPYWFLRWREQRLSKPTMYRVECADGLELGLCESCASACQTICDSDVRVSTFYMKSAITFRALMRKPNHAWFRLHRVER